MKIIKPGLVALLTSAAIYGSFGVMIRLLSYELSLTSQVIFRYSLALVILISMVLVTKAKLKFKKESILPMLGLALFMQISITNFTKATLLIPISSLIGAFYIGSLVTATLTGIFVYKEKISWTGASSTLLAGLGLWLLTLNGGNFAGLILAIIAGSAESVTQAIRKSAPNLSKGVTAVIAIFGILMFTLLQNIFNKEVLMIPRLPLTWLVGIVFGLAAVFVNIAVTYGFRKIPINLGSIIMSTEIGFGALFGLIVLGMKPSLTELVTITLITVAVIVQNITIKNDAKILVFVRKILEG